MCGRVSDLTLQGSVRCVGVQVTSCLEGRKDLVVDSDRLKVKPNSSAYVHLVRRMWCNFSFCLWFLNVVPIVVMCKPTQKPKCKCLCTSINQNLSHKRLWINFLELAQLLFWTYVILTFKQCCQSVSVREYPIAYFGISKQIECL